MPQVSRFTPTPSPTNRISNLTEDDLDYLPNAQLEPSSNPDPIRPNIGSRNQEHTSRGAERETGLQIEQLVAFGMAEDGAITTVQTARYDEDSDASFRRRVKRGRSEEPATSSMEVSDQYYHSSDGRMSTEHTLTVTLSNRSTQNPQSHGHCTDETRTAEHTSTVTDTTDGTSLPDIDEGDEVIGEDQIDHIDHLPPQANIILHHFREYPVPPNIVQRAYSFADQSDVTVTEEEFLSFERQSLEAKKHTLKVFFKELAYLETANDIDEILAVWPRSHS